jgi:hypothetical protein
MVKEGNHYLVTLSFHPSERRSDWVLDFIDGQVAKKFEFNIQECRKSRSETEESLYFKQGDRIVNRPFGFTFQINKVPKI